MDITKRAMIWFPEVNNDILNLKLVDEIATDNEECTECSLHDGMYLDKSKCQMYCKNH